MAKYMVNIKVNGQDYMTSTFADSLLSAEHRFLDAGVCGAGKYGCEAAMAFDAKTMKTETFIGACLWSTVVSEAEAVKIIEQMNAKIKEEEELKKELEKISKEAAKMAKAMDELKNKQEELQKKLNRMKGVA